MKELLIKFKNKLTKKTSCEKEEFLRNNIDFINKKIDCILRDLKLPTYDAPNESDTVKLVEEDFEGKNYNLLFFLDRYWLVNQGEGAFEVNKILSDKVEFPMLIADSKEELAIAIANIWLLNNPNPNKKMSEEGFYYVKDNVFLVNVPKAIAEQKLINVPAYKNSKIDLENIFEPSDQPVTIICLNPSRSCNYRCPYCYHHDHDFDANLSGMTQWCRTIITACEKIQRPIRFSAGSMGEPLSMPRWRETAIKVLNHDNVLSLSFVSNLFFPLEPFFDHVDAHKVGLMASLHPSQYKEPEKDFDKFLGKLAKLKAMGVDCVVNYVLTPEQIKNFKWYRSQIHAIGVPTTSNVLRGPYKGKIYPEAFTKEELELIEDCYDENSYIFDSQSHFNSPYGKECLSGKEGFELLFDGNLINCGFARNRFGSIYDDKLYIRKSNSFCTACKCECQTLIGWQKDVADKFEVQRTLQHYVKKN
tara:strand:+ start:546 stop:1967 length:1422 start_codon:yes stop_codon:yes gene_type:complete